MLPLSDGLPARRFPVVTVALIAANLAVWVFYELPDLGGAVAQSSFYPCDVENTCERPCRGRSAGSRRCSCTRAGITSSATCSSSRSSARTSRTRSAASATSPSTSPAASPPRRLQTAMTLLFSSDADARVPHARRERRDLGRARGVPRAVPACAHQDARARVLRADPRLGSTWAAGSSTSSTKRTTRSSPRPRTEAAWRSSRTSAGSCSVGSSHGRCSTRSGSDRQRPCRRPLRADPRSERRDDRSCRLCR